MIAEISTIEEEFEKAVLREFVTRLLKPILRNKYLGMM
jgi:hypothetical protein